MPHTKFKIVFYWFMVTAIATKKHNRNAIFSDNAAQKKLIENTTNQSTMEPITDEKHLGLDLGRCIKAGSFSRDLTVWNSTKWE